MTCEACGRPIVPAEVGEASCWADPAGQVCAAHDRCLAPFTEAELAVTT